jgi:hypothetical protein
MVALAAAEGKGEHGWLSMTTPCHCSVPAASTLPVLPVQCMLSWPGCSRSVRQTWYGSVMQAGCAAHHCCRNRCPKLSHPLQPPTRVLLVVHLCYTAGRSVASADTPRPSCEHCTKSHFCSQGEPPAPGATQASSCTSTPLPCGVIPQQRGMHAHPRLTCVARGACDACHAP